ncbi:MAG: GrdX family protein [Synergistaceae bacterium]|jgi:hypothetical protein|nr:GrdX family protein [Synergistaceae bacterium]
MRNGAGSVVLITNNVSLERLIVPFSLAAQLVKGSSLNVLITVRDAVHLGSRLLTHPLYGNLRPHQQPFRSVLIETNPNALVDLESLSMIEEAVLLYRGFENNLPLPEDLPHAVREDYAYVDLELMRESVERCKRRLTPPRQVDGFYYHGTTPENERFYI